LDVAEVDSGVEHGGHEGVPEHVWMHPGDPHAGLLGEAAQPSGWFAVVVVLVVFNTVIGEELLFRGLLLPRMRGVFGRGDWVGNGVLFAAYHLHVPWVIPISLVEGIFLEAYPSRRFQSAWMGIIVHSGQSVFVIVVVLTLVL